MTPVDRFERELPGLLEELFLGPTPSYRDDVLSLTAKTNQRPGWTLAERWIPMDTIAERAALPPLPWRTVGAVALVVLLLAAAAVFLAGNRQTRLPEPFGPAANGRIAYSSKGDIYTVDPRTGETSAVVTGPDDDRSPIWSLDGTKIAFTRSTAGQTGERLMVAAADGGSLRSLTTEPRTAVRQYSFSPDGRDVMFVSDIAGVPTISIARADGGGVRTLDVGMPASEPQYRPPEGSQIAFAGKPTSDPEVAGVYVVNVDGSGLREVATASRSSTAELPRWSPDGARIAYDAADFTVTTAWTVATHVVAADGSDNRIVAGDDALWGGQPVWSNDGRSIAHVRGYSVNDDSDVVLSVVPVDGNGPAATTARRALAGWPSAYEWSPDDSVILVTPVSLPGGLGTPIQQVLLDPLTGNMHEAPWDTTSGPTWQRLAAEGS